MKNVIAIVMMIVTSNIVDLVAIRVPNAARTSKTPDGLSTRKNAVLQLLAVAEGTSNFEIKVVYSNSKNSTIK